MSTPLPKEFQELQPFVADWALATRAERFKRRHTGNMEEIRAYYDVIMPRVQDIVAHLNQFPLDAIPEDSKPLLHMSLSAVEIARCVEIWDAPDNNAFDPNRTIIDL